MNTTTPNPEQAACATDFFDVNLSDAERERLAVLMEECAEAQHVIGKILRHGYESRHPNGGPTNREMLERELGDIACAAHMLVAAEDLRGDVISEAEKAKRTKIVRYLHFQPAELFYE